VVAVGQNSGRVVSCVTIMYKLLDQPGCHACVVNNDGWFNFNIQQSEPHPRTFFLQKKVWYPPFIFHGVWVSNSGTCGRRKSCSFNLVFCSFVHLCIC